MESKIKSQKAKILNRLKAGQTITSMQALNWYGCARAASRVNELRNDGYSIKTEMIKVNDSRVARYKLIK